MSASLLQGGKKSGKSCRPHSSTVGVKSWDMHWRMKNTGHRKAVQDRETANRGTEARGSKACEDGRRETNLLQTVFFIQSQISWKPDVIELVGKIDVLSSSLTFKLKKSDLSVLKWKNQRNSKNTLGNVKICHQSWKKLQMYYLRWRHCGAWQGWSGYTTQASRPSCALAAGMGHHAIL